MHGGLRHPGPARSTDSSPDPVLDVSDVMRDALSDLLQAESRYAPVVDGDLPVMELMNSMNSSGSSR